MRVASSGVASSVLIGQYHDPNGDADWPASDGWLTLVFLSERTLPACRWYRGRGFGSACDTENGECERSDKHPANYPTPPHPYNPPSRHLLHIRVAMGRSGGKLSDATSNLVDGRTPAFSPSGVATFNRSGPIARPGLDASRSHPSSARRPADEIPSSLIGRQHALFAPCLAMRILKASLLGPARCRLPARSASNEGGTEGASGTSKGKQR
jgi:hypothetical protein